MANPFGKAAWNWNGTNYTMYDDSLVLMMNFDNVSAIGENATKVVDVSKNSNNGTVYGGAVWNSSGKYGATMQFNGSSQYITISNNIPLSNFTISAWVKLNSFPPSSATVISNDGWGNFNGAIDFVIDNSHRIVSVSCANGGKDYYRTTSTSLLTLGHWSHITASLNGNTPHIFVNGLEVSGAFDVGNSMRTPNQNSAYTLKIGVIGNQGGGDYWNGTIDELRIWNRALSANEIAQQYMSNLYKFNQTQWYLLVNQSKNATTGLGAGSYTYYARAADSSSNSSTETRRLNIGALSPPNVTTFAAGTTNFSSVPDLFDVNNMVLATAATKVRWTGLVSVSGNDYDSNIKMGSKFVSINVSALDQTINSSAVVNMSGINCASFNLYYATGFYSDAASLIAGGTKVADQSNVGGNCADATKCTALSCSGGVLTFTAQHFDGFGEQDIPSYVPEFGTWALLLALGLVAGGIVSMRKK